jgi:hypothetical protein
MDDASAQIPSAFAEEELRRLLPEVTADRFFEALLGDAGDGAYDIRLSLEDARPGRLVFHLNLDRRQGKCLACHLTSGLPHVFARHPVIDLEGLVGKIQDRLDDGTRVADWQLEATMEISQDLHAIPLVLNLEAESRP